LLAQSRRGGDSLCTKRACALFTAHNAFRCEALTPYRDNQITVLARAEPCCLLSPCFFWMFSFDRVTFWQHVKRTARSSHVSPSEFQISSQLGMAVMGVLFA
jgi:hypothetical protein